MPNQMPTYMEEIMVMETMKPLNKLQKKSVAKMKKVLSKGNVLSQKQKKELELYKQIPNIKEEELEVLEPIPVPEGYGLDTQMLMGADPNSAVRTNEAAYSHEETHQGLGLDTEGYMMNADPNSAVRKGERYQREAKKGEASPKDFSTAKKADPRSAVRPSEADLNDRLEADRQVGMPNVFDLMRTDSASAVRPREIEPSSVVRKKEILLRSK